ncbi:zinc finger BED domain-containing protein 4-like [Leptopilina heterotoma]|uniref:zinc finger BED domain-containing protein 4-like n=1 Tax=Leptopilina heterotoma TaxID=63436 RepID=UPI001CA7E8B0|nr:zinc finger BED domain-containing protein 4-like [Leptopilina heterotoma]
MLERFLLLSGFVTVVLMNLQRNRSSKSKPPIMLTAVELEIMQEVKDVLKPLWQVTLEMSSEKIVTLSKCIPLINAMRCKINGIETRTKDGFNFKKKLQSLVEAKFSNVEFVKPYSAATLLDPRFKKDVFTNIVAASKAVTHIGSLVSECIGVDSRNLVQNSQKVSSSEDSLWFEFDQSVKDKVLNADQDVANGIPVEMRQYFNRPIINRIENPNPLAAWAVLKGEYPHVYKVALQFLPVLATSVPAERLFSHTGLIATKLRNRISGKHLDQLVFMRSLDEKWFN